MKENDQKLVSKNQAATVEKQNGKMVEAQFKCWHQLCLLTFWTKGIRCSSDGIVLKLVSQVSCWKILF